MSSFGLISAFLLVLHSPSFIFILHPLSSILHPSFFIQPLPPKTDIDMRKRMAQVNLLGSRSRLSLDVQCPTDDVSAAFLLSDVDRAVSRALGVAGDVGGGLTRSSSVPGPVHLNFMFRENLAPVAGAIR